MSCKCQKCGKDYCVDINIPAELWKIINYKHQGEFNLLCPECVVFGIIIYHACQRGKKKHGAYELTATSETKPCNNVGCDDYRKSDVVKSQCFKLKWGDQNKCVFYRA